MSSQPRTRSPTRQPTPPHSLTAPAPSTRRSARPWTRSAAGCPGRGTGESMPADPGPSADPHAPSACPADIRCPRCRDCAGPGSALPADRVAKADPAAAADPAATAGCDNRIRLTQVEIGRQEEEAVLAVLRSGMLAGGAQVAELERAFATAHGAAHAGAVSNGTTALVAALRAHGIGAGDEVITTPLTFVATLNAILEAGAVARFADIADDLTIDPARLASLVTPRTRALLPVHLYGLPAAMADRKSTRLNSSHGSISYAVF